MARKEASRCEAVGERWQLISCCCSNRQRVVWGTRSVLQPKAEGVGRVLTRRAGVSPFPVDPEGERSSFRAAESSRKSSALSMPERSPRRVGRRFEDRQRGGLGGILELSSTRSMALVGATLGPGGGNDR